VNNSSLIGTQRLVFVLTLVYFFIELIGGLHYNSLALVTDAGFMAIDLAGQLSAIYAGRLSQRPPDKYKTFGYERAKVLSGLFNGIFVGFMLFYVLTDAYRRIGNPEFLDVDRVFIIAVIGLFINGYSVFQLYEHSKDIAVKGSFLFLLNDTLGSVGVIISSIIIKFTGLYVIDAVTSIVIGLFVAYPTYFLVKDSINILMEANPARIDIKKVEGFIYENFDHAKNVKDLHIWALVPEKTIMTVKIRTEGRVYDREKIRSLKKLLEEKFGLYDVFVEVYEED
jgi:cobalt-zinc-cadmium efflux system protein